MGTSSGWHTSEAEEQADFGGCVQCSSERLSYNLCAKGIENTAPHADTEELSAIGREEGCIGSPARPGTIGQMARDLLRAGVI